MRRGFEPRHGAFVGQKFHQLLVEFLLLAQTVARVFVGRRLGRARLREVAQLLIGIAMRRRVELRFDHAHRRGQHKHASEPAAIKREVFFFFDSCIDRIGGDGSVRSRRPGFGIRDQRKMPRRNFARFKDLVGPAAPKRSPRFLVHIREAPRAERLDGILACLPDIRRIGQPRPVHIGEIAHHLHDVRMLGFFVLELADDRKVRREPVRLRCRQGERECQDHDGGKFRVDTSVSFLHGRLKFYPENGIARHSFTTSLSA